MTVHIPSASLTFISFRYFSSLADRSVLAIVLSFLFQRQQGHVSILTREDCWFKSFHNSVASGVVHFTHIRSVCERQNLNELFIACQINPHLPSLNDKSKQIVCQCYFYFALVQEAKGCTFVCGIKFCFSCEINTNCQNPALSRSPLFNRGKDT